jgi:hypothetical protein
MIVIPEMIIKKKRHEKGLFSYSDKPFMYVNGEVPIA